MLRPPFSQEPISIDKWDVIVIGAGAAGLMTCLELPDNLNVLLLNRNTSKRSSSRWAQGGIASVVRPEDSFACLLYTSPSPRDRTRSRMPSSA